MEARPLNEPYVYEPLIYHSARLHPLRLLRIHQDEPDTTISCELFSTHIHKSSSRSHLGQYKPLPWRFTEESHSGHYVALSYVWGDTVDEIAIRVNGKELFVTRNLWSALLRERDTFMVGRSKDVLFWIDAICIDQSNVEERNKQVICMDYIYRGAKGVLVWLGEETPLSRIAFESCCSLAADEPTKDVKLAYKATFSGEWFERLWVLQEVCHARSVAIRSGSLQINWNTLRKVAGHGMGDWRRQFEKIDGLRQFTVATRGLANFVLECFGSRKCLDPRDTIFALRSLANDLESVHPDYSMCTADVFTSATRSIISDSRTLLVLLQVSRALPSSWSSFESKSLPSWVPDWKMPPYARCINRQDFNLDACNGQRMSPDPLSHNDPAILLVSGIAVDEILYATAPFRWEFPNFETFELEEPKSKTDSQNLPDLDQRWASLEQQMHQWFPKCNEYFIRRHCSSKRRGSFGLTTLVDQHIQQLGMKAPAFHTMKAAVESLAFSPLSDHQPMLKRYSFVITRDGYIGFVVGEPQQGDLVFVAYGSDVPLALRRVERNDPSYSFIGCGILEGLMRGEAIDLKDTGRLDEQTIQLV